MDEPATVPSAQRAAALAREWIDAAKGGERSGPRSRPIQRLLDDPGGPRFTMAFVDRVMRAPSRSTAAAELHDLVRDLGVPSLLGFPDGLLLRAGATLAPRLPGIVMPLAVGRVRALTSDLVVPAEDRALTAFVRGRAHAGMRVNANGLGEAVLGEAEAMRRLDRAISLLRRGDIDHVSVKVSAFVSQLVLWGYATTLERVAARLRVLYREAAATDPPSFVNLDMEEYRDLDLTLDAFCAVLDEDEFATLDAGVVLQAYLPDSFERLRRLVDWSSARHARTGGRIKVRIVKGANLAMERVDAELHGWPQAPYLTKHETDANWKRMVEWSMRPDHIASTRLGIASHNLLDVAWAHLMAEDRQVADGVRFEMLAGMAPAHATIVRDAIGNLLLYTPVVRRDEFPAAIAYLFRRLEENTAPQNFLRQLFSLAPGSSSWDEQFHRFARALAAIDEVASSPRRTQRRDGGPVEDLDLDSAFRNEPDTDPALRGNRTWMAEVVQAWSPPVIGDMGTVATVDAAVARAAIAAAGWAATSARRRGALLESAGAAIAAARGVLISAMVHEGGKAVTEADAEVSEAVDFARYYARQALRLDDDDASFVPAGVVAITPPWNFPVAIAAGGMLAALAAGNTVIVKPPPETPASVRLVVDAIHGAGVDPAVLQYLRIPDDDVGRRLVTHPDVAAVVLTGSWETAERFRSWRPDLALFGETSGKNAMVVTERADLDAAVADLVTSAFGHAGQKCSAASLAIVEGAVLDDATFSRQLVDAVGSLRVGVPTDLSVRIGTLIGPPGDRLDRALGRLDPGERWLVAPRRLSDDGRVWQPGVRIGVAPGSWFHHTECFGPVLGIMRASDLAEATEWQNAVSFGLTGGLWSLDPDEIDWWLAHVEVGNAYVNRPTTGAIVGRQPFGGWKKSVVGPGAKAGGPNYVAQFGTWHDRGRPTRTRSPSAAVAEMLERAREVGIVIDRVLVDSVSSDEWWWQEDYGREHDPSGLAVESNVLRYRPLPTVVLRVGPTVAPQTVIRLAAAARRCGTPMELSTPRPVDRITQCLAPGVETVIEDEAELGARLGRDAIGRVRHLAGPGDDLRRAAASAGVHLDTTPPSVSGRVELLRWLREQSVSRTLHRYGNVMGRTRSASR